MSDVEKPPEDGEAKAEPAVKGPKITIEGNPGEAFRKLPASVLGKPEIAATRLGEAVKVATGTSHSSWRSSARTGGSFGSGSRSSR